MRATLLAFLLVPALAQASPDVHCRGYSDWERQLDNLESNIRERRAEAVAFYSTMGCRVGAVARSGQINVDCTGVPCMRDKNEGPQDVPKVLPPVQVEPPERRLIPYQVYDPVFLPVPPAPNVQSDQDGLCSCSSSAIPIGGTTTCSYVGPANRLLWSIDEGGVTAGRLNIVAELHSAPGVRAATVVGREAGSINVRWQPDKLCDVVTVVADAPVPEPEPPPIPSRLERIMTSPTFWGGMAGVATAVIAIRSAGGGDSRESVR